MNTKSIAFVALRIVALFLFVKALINVGNLVVITLPNFFNYGHDGQISALSLIPLFIPALLMFIISIILWVRTQALSEWLAPFDDEVQIEGEKLEKLQIIAFTVVGLVFVAISFPHLVKDVVQMVSFDRDMHTEMVYRHQVVYPLIHSSVQFVLGMVILFQAKGLSGLLKKVRDL